VSVTIAVLQHNYRTVRRVYFFECVSVLLCTEVDVFELHHIVMITIVTGLDVMFD